MTKWTKLVFAMLACAIISMAAVRAEDAPPAGGNNTGGGGGGRGNFDPAKMREMMQTRLKDSMGATDEEWKALQPKIDDLMKVRDAERSSMRGMYRRPGSGDQTTADANKTDLQKKTEALKALVDAKDSDPKAIQDALKGLRDEREKNRAAVKKAQESLKELLSAKQEAILVMYGMME